MIILVGYYDLIKNVQDLKKGDVEVDPILWTKKGHSLATLLPAFLTGNSACSCFFVGLAVSPLRRVKRRLALLASIQPRDNSAEGTPMASPLCHAEQGSFPPIGYLSHAS